MNKPIRHGEILLLPIDELPAGKSEKHDLFIVGHSETGHHHILESKSKFTVLTDIKKQELYLQLFEPAKLVHKKTINKHKALPVKPGIYKVIHKTEYDPFLKVKRAV